MTPLEADKLNKELIECKRREENNSQMLRQFAAESVEKDNTIEQLERDNAYLQGVIYFWRIAFGIQAILTIIIGMIKLT